MNFLYLHGFASSPESTKAIFFKNLLEKEFNSKIICPDLNYIPFDTLSLSLMVEKISHLIIENTIIIGSSLGGFLAVLLAQKFPTKIKSLILMAPAFNIVQIFKNQMTNEQFNNWQISDSLIFKHDYLNEDVNLKFNFINDALLYDKNLYEISQTTLLFHGLNDETIPYNYSFKYLKSKSLKSIFINSDHSLLDSLDFIGLKSIEFINSEKKN